MDDLFAQPVLLDGATGTELRRRGMPVGVCTEQWILEHPEELLDLQRAYVAAGAMVLTAPTFGAAGNVEEDYRRLVALSRRASGGRALVAGDIGPGDTSPAIKAAALRAAGVDLYLIETMLSVEEAVAAVKAVRAEEPQKPVLVSFYPHAGLDATEAYTAMAALEVDGFGFNCAPPGVILEYLERLAPQPVISLLAMPGCEGLAPTDILARYAQRFAALGVRYFGGCCGMGSEHLAELKKALERC